MYYHFLFITDMYFMFCLFLMVINKQVDFVLFIILFAEDYTIISTWVTNKQWN